MLETPVFYILYAKVLSLCRNSMLGEFCYLSLCFSTQDIGDVRTLNLYFSSFNLNLALLLTYTHMLLSHKLTYRRHMTDIIFHKSNKYINDDIDYYASDTRDKHGAIKPVIDIKSYTLDSLNFDNDSESPSLFYPFQKHSIDRIYLGISFPLYANNWGAEFLRYLMYIIKKDGAVIFPVYAERQGVEKNYWSRSILEVAFQSRQKWWGMSNIWAENDGVMSMRIGKKEPKVRNSTFTHFINRVIPELYMKNNHNQLKTEINNQNKNLRLSAVVEKIILDNHGRNKKINLGIFSDNPLVGIELACSDYMNIKNTKVYSNNKKDILDYSDYIPNNIPSKYSHFITDVEKLATDAINDEFYKDDLIVANTKDNLDMDTRNLIEGHNVILIDEEFYNEDLGKKIIESALGSLEKDGFIILINRHLSNTYKSIDHSHTVGTKLKEGYDIPHYSDFIFEELRQENLNRDTAVQVIHKKDNV